MRFISSVKPQLTHATSIWNLQFEMIQKQCVFRAIDCYGSFYIFINQFTYYYYTNTYMLNSSTYQIVCVCARDCMQQ